MKKNTLKKEYLRFDDCAIVGKFAEEALEIIYDKISDSNNHYRSTRSIIKEGVLIEMHAAVSEILPFPQDKKIRNGAIVEKCGVEDRKYLMYYISLDGVWGLKEWEDTYQWKRLKLHTFLANRFEDTQSIIDSIVAKRKSLGAEVTVKIESLVEGYNNTQINSCMQGNGNFFESINDYGKLYTFTHPLGEARCIVWNEGRVDGFDGEYKGFYDRIYIKGDSKLEDKVIEYFKAKEFVDVCNSCYRLKLLLDKPLGKVQMPYMDTFKYYDEGDTFLSSYDGSYTLDSTSGNVLIGTTCDCCGGSYAEDDLTYVESADEFVCPSCLDDNYVFTYDRESFEHRDNVFYCQTDSNYYSDDIDLVYVNSEYYRRDDDDIYYCECCNEYYCGCDSMHYTKDDEFVCENCLDEFYVRCQDDGEYHRYNDRYIYEDADGKWWSSKEAYLEHNDDDKGEDNE